MRRPAQQVPEPRSMMVSPLRAPAGGGVPLLSRPNWSRFEEPDSGRFGLSCSMAGIRLQGAGSVRVGSRKTIEG
jgi:hypothetical protein